jgi:hypothetical protein
VNLFKNDPWSRAGRAGYFRVQPLLVERAGIDGEVLYSPKLRDVIDDRSEFLAFDRNMMAVLRTVLVDSHVSPASGRVVTAMIGVPARGVGVRIIRTSQGTILIDENEAAP